MTPQNCLREDDVIARLHTGDEKALEYLFRQYQAALLYFALQFVKDRQAAEDYVAESFIKVWHRKTGFTNFASIKSFLYISVKNSCLDHRKQEARHAQSHKKISYLAERAEELFSVNQIKAELLEKLMRDIEQLPPMRRRIFKMIYVEGKSSIETASVLKISVDTVRVQKARALHALRAIRRQDPDCRF